MHYAAIAAILCETRPMRRTAAGTVVVLAIVAAEATTLQLEVGPPSDAGIEPAQPEATFVTVVAAEAEVSGPPPSRSTPSPSQSDPRPVVPDPIITETRTVAADAAAVFGELAPGGTFFDDDGSTHEGPIEAIAGAGITRGCGTDDLFCPDRAVTRGEMAAFLNRAFALPAADTDRFSDDDGTVFEADIEAIAELGITRGCDPPDNTRYCPADPVTRAEMAAFLDRALDLDPSAADAFSDDDGSIFEGHVDALASAGITVGCAEDRFCPRDPVLRAQMASFLQRALGLTPVTPPPRPSVTLAFTGDVLVHRPVWQQAAVYGEPFDFGPMFAPVAETISSADLALCHLETPLSATNTGLSGYPTFNAPRQVADALAGVGYDGCSTASNHSFDQGPEGIADTVAVLDEAGLGQAGMAARAEDAGAARYRVGDVDVAHISATWWLNGLRLPLDQPWLVQLLDVEHLLAQAAAARGAGAEVVVVSVHCCTEYQREPTPYQRDVARALISSPDVDLVVGHHAHVVQPIEEVDGEVIVYGLGNFLSAQRSRPATQDGVIVLTELALRGDRWSTRSVSAVPTWVEGDSYRILPAAGHNDASWRRTREALLAEGSSSMRVLR